MSVATIGSEILVNTATTGFQGNPQITTLSNGGFVVTWTDFSQGDGGATGDNSQLAVKAQVFSATGAKIGSEILVNTATDDNQDGPKITALANGGFVVTWADESLGVDGATGDSSGRAVKAQLFAADGAEVGSEIRVNTATENDQDVPLITALANGGFVVTWVDGSEGNGGATGDDSDSAIKAQVFDADGNETGLEILVNTATESFQHSQKIAELANGGFVMTWMDFGEGGGGHAVKAQVFTAGGAKVGSEILVGAIADPVWSHPQITTLPNGGFVVTWHDGNVNGIGELDGDVKAQMFAATGARVGGQISVNTGTSGAQSGQQIVPLLNGGFVITWNNDGGMGDINAQAFTATGAKAGPEILVNAGNDDAQALPQITALSNGGFVITWRATTGPVGDSATDVRAQVFTAGGAKFGPELLVNTATESFQEVHSVTALENGGFAVTWMDASEGVGGTTGDSDGYAIKAQVFSVTDLPTGVTITGTGTADTIDATHAPAGQPNPTDEADTISGFGGDDLVHGLDGADLISGGGGNDTLHGDAGYDKLNGGAGADEMYGGAGNDSYIVDQSGDTVIEDSDAGVDSVTSSASFTLGDNVEDLVLKGSEDLDGNGNGLANKITGNTGDNTLEGGGGNDTLKGLDGDDVLIGGVGTDIMFGGAGIDTFVFELLTDSVNGTARDVIKDFAAGTDKIDLLSIDANTGAGGDQAFTFIGAAAFSHTAGELRATLAGNNTLISGDVNGNGQADFQILVAGHVAFQAGDFLP
jgi:Ca2+-binding RTX toxin-like protein